MNAQMVTGPGEGPDLSRYPLLVYYDGAVRTEDRGIPVESLRDIWCATHSVAKVAEQQGTTASHVNQALEYLSSTEGAA